MYPVIVQAKFEVRDNSDWSFGWGANLNLEKSKI